MKKTSTKRLGIAFPYLLITSIVIGYLIALYIGRIDFMIRGLGIAIPTISAALLLPRFYKNDFDFKNYISFSKINERCLVYLFCILILVSTLVLLFNHSRPVYYFAIITALYVIIFFQLFSKRLNPVIILSEIMLVMSNLIYGVTLKYPLYFGAVDTLDHLWLSNVTYLSGHVIPADLDFYYFNFPLLHILIAEGSLILNLGIKNSYYLITPPAYILLVVLIYYLFEKIIYNKQISLLTCLLYSMSATVIFYGTYTVTRTLAYFGFMVLLYSLFLSNRDGVNKNKISFKFLTILLTAFTILVHQVSIAQIVIVMIILFVCEWVINDKKYLTTTFYTLIIVSFVGYWFYPAYVFTNKLISDQFQQRYFESIIIKSSIQSGYEWIFLYNNIDSFIFLFFALIGIGCILWKGKPKYASVIGLFALITLALYVPTPLQMIWQTMKLFRFDRFMLLISPFMAFVMAIGIYSAISYVITKNKLKKAGIIIIILLFTGFALSSVLYQYSTLDSEDLHWNSPRTYFNNKELVGFNHVYNHVPFGTSLYSDYYAENFFDQINFSGTESLSLPHYKSIRIYSPEYLPNYNGYKIIRTEELFDNGLKFGSRAKGYIYTYSSSEENRRLLFENLTRNDKIYSNYAVEIYYQ